MKQSMENMDTTPSHTIDLSIHGIVSLRLIGATAKDFAGIIEQLAPTQASLSAEPDITIRFKDKLAPPKLRYLGLNFVGFTEEGFYILGRRNGTVKARIPFENIGQPCEILCQSGLSSVPLLSEIINLTFLKKNYLPLHASAFRYRECGILVMGWTKGGKTEALLSFANHGAQYVGDEWVILSENGDRMFGLPIPLTIWNWLIPQVPNLLPSIDRPTRILFAAIGLLDAIDRRLGHGRWRYFFPSAILSRALPALNRQRKVLRSPQEMFKHRCYNGETTPDILLLMMSHSDPAIQVERCHAVELAERMKSSNEYEQLPFREYYKAFKFAFAHRENEFLEQADALQSSLLQRAFRGKDAYKVLHPYPVSLQALFTELQPFCQPAPPGSACPQNAKCLTV